MELKQALLNRRSIRLFKPDPVPKKTLEEIMETAKWAGSGMNSQPWEFTIMAGDKMEELRTKLAEASGPPEMEFPGGMPMPEAQAKRASEYVETSTNYNFPPGTEDIEAKKQAFMAVRARLSNAPHIIVVYADKAIVNSPWGFTSIGLICQNICLAALDYDLGTCILGGPAGRPKIIREVCGIPDDKTIVCGIIIGYPDQKARINHFPRTRLELGEFVRWQGF